MEWDIISWQPACSTTVLRMASGCVLGRVGHHPPMWFGYVWLHVSMELGMGCVISVEGCVPG